MMRMVKGFLFLIIFLLQIGLLIGQEQRGDTTDVLALKAKGLTYYPGQLDSVFYHYELGLNLARELKYYTGEAIMLRSRGFIKSFSGDVDGAVQDIEEAKKIIIQRGLSAEELVNCFINQGAAYDRAVQVDLALEQYIEGEKIAREEGLTAKRTMLLNNLGIAYRRLERYEEAVDIYQEAIKLRSELRDTAGVATLTMNMSSAQGRLNDTIASLENGREAIELYRALGAVSEMTYAQNNYGYLLSEYGFYDKAVDVLEEVQKADLTGWGLDKQLIARHTYAHALRGAGNYKRSEEIFRSFEDDLEKTDFQEIKRESYADRALNNQSLGNYKRAFEMLQKHVVLLEDYNKESTIKARQEMESKYLAIEKDLQIEKQNAEIDRASRERRFYMLGLFALVALAGLLYRLSQVRKRANQVLDEKNSIISNALSEKELLLREIHHRVKNNLQFISSLLRLQSDHVDDPTALDALQQGHDRVRSMALIHQNLYKEDNLTGVNTKDYFTKLITGLFKSNNIHDDRIKLDLNVSELNLDVDTIVPIGLITNELVTNSLKYAFPEERQGTVHVSLKESDGKLDLSVYDDGVGMSNDFENALGESFGYKLINALVGQLDGDLAFHDSSGTSVDISIGRYEKV